MENDSYLGLDISTSIVGYSIIDRKKKLLSYGHVDISNIEDIYEKLSIVIDRVSKLILEYKIKEIFIEKFLYKFAAGKSRIQTLIKLCEMNSLIKFECFNLLKKKPILLNVLHARKIVIGKTRSKDFTSVKEFVISHVSKIYPQIIWDKKISKKTKEEKLLNYNFDIADSIVINLAGILSIEKPISN